MKLFLCWCRMLVWLIMVWFVLMSFMLVIILICSCCRICVMVCCWLCVRIRCSVVSIFGCWLGCCVGL